MKRFLILSIFCFAVWGLPACSALEKKIGIATPTPRVKFGGDLITIDDNGTASIEFENDNIPLQVAIGELKTLTTSKTRDNSRLMIVPGAGTRASAVLEIVEVVRPVYKENLNVQIADDLGAFVSLFFAEQLPTGLAKPNPLTLVVKIDDKGDIVLNNEPHGSLSNMTPLRERLREVFKARAENGALRPGTNVVETTILMKLSTTIVWQDVRTLAAAIRESGSDRIGLLLKDFEFGIETRDYH